MNLWIIQSEMKFLNYHIFDYKNLFWNTIQLIWLITLVCKMIFCCCQKCFNRFYLVWRTDSKSVPMSCVARKVSKLWNHIYNKNPYHYENNVHLFIKALKKHNYDLANYFGDADCKSVARFIVEDTVFDVLNCTPTYLRVKLVNQILKNRIKKEILLIRHSRNGFTLKLNNSVYSMSCIAFLSNINYVFTPLN